MSLKMQSNFILFGINKPSSLKLITLSSESFQLDSRFDETVPRLMTLLIHIRWIPHQKKNTMGDTGKSSIAAWISGAPASIQRC